MDRKKSRRFDWIGNRAGVRVGAEPEEAEEVETEGLWEERKRTIAEGHCLGRGDDDYTNYVPPKLEFEAAAAFSDLELAILFVFGPRYAGLPMISRG